MNEQKVLLPGYEYRNAAFELVHVSSFDTDEKALFHFGFVADNLDDTVRYIARREPEGSTYQYMPWVYDPNEDVILTWEAAHGSPAQER